MVSRRAILSRSRDDLNLDDPKQAGGEDQWFSKEKLYKDHIKEVLEKWDNIDDEIWAKVIVLERNRRIAKAYARAPVLTVNGSEDGFDGFRIGVNGFDNPLRDPKTEEFKKQIGTGCKLKMDDTGNILVKRLAKSHIYVKNTLEENAVSNDILKLGNGLLEADKPFKLFDMKKFQQNVNREIKRQYPERQKLETQCISTIALVKNEPEVLDSPIWIMLINVVALEMLKAKMPRMSAGGPRMNNPTFVGGNGIGGGKKPAGSGSSDEDPYSLTPSGSSGSSKGLRPGAKDYGQGAKDYYGPHNWAVKGGVNDLSDEYVEIRMSCSAMFNLTLVCLGMMFSGASYFLAVPIYPSQALARNVSVTETGIVLGSAFLATFLFTPLSGIAISRFGVKNMFVTGNIICGLGNIGFGFLDFIESSSPYFWLSVGTRVFSALGEAIVTPTAMALGLSQVADKNKGKTITLIEACFGIGMAIGPGFCGLLYRLGGFVLPFWLFGGLILIVAVLSCCIASKKDQQSLEKKENTSWRDLLSCPYIYVYSLGWMCASSSQDWYSGFLEPHLKNKFELGSEHVGLIVLAFGLTYTFAVPVFGVVVDRGFSPFGFFVSGQITIALSMYFLGPIPVFWHSTDNILVIIFALVCQAIGLASASCGSILGLLQAAQAGGLPNTDETMGMVTSFWMCWTCIGSLLGTPLGSFFYDLGGWNVSFSIQAVITSISILSACIFKFCMDWKN